MAGIGSLDQELGRVSANPRCPIGGASLRPIAPPCPAAWAYRHTRAIPGELWLGPDSATFTVANQDGMISTARNRASLIAPPPGTRLYRITFSHQCSGGGGGMGVTCRVSGAAHFGICGVPHD